MSKKYPVTAELKQSIENKLDDLLQVIQHHFPAIVLPPISITYNYSGYMAGWAMPLQYRINLHPVLLNKYPQYMTDNILGHELAHIVTHHLYGYDIDQHGKEWAEVMDVLNIEPNPVHDLDVDCIKRKVAQYKYVCQCKDMTHFIGSRWNKAMRVDKKIIVCTTCENPLVPIEEPIYNSILPINLLNDTKIEKARWIVENNYALPRNELVELIMRGAGLSKAGASTYYHNLTSGVD